MKKNIKKSLPWILLTFLVFGYLGYKLREDSKGIHLAIGNESKETVVGLRVTYNNITEDILIPHIDPGMKYDITIEQKENFLENQMKLQYIDKVGEVHEEIILPYFQKGYNGKVFVKIKDINEDGVITVEVK